MADVEIVLTEDPRLPASAGAFLATKTATQNLPGGGVLTLVTFESAAVNVGGAFDLAGERFVADVAGLMVVHAVLYGTGTADLTNVALSLYRNGARYKPVGGAHGASNRVLIATGAAMVPLAAGDQLQLYAEYFTPTGTADLVLAANHTAFMGHWIRR